MLLRDLPRGAAVARVVRVDIGDPRKRLFHIAEAQQSLAGRKKFPEAGLLGQDRAAAGEVARAAIAEPSGPQFPIRGLGALDFRARARDELAIVLRRGGYAPRVEHGPSVELQQLAVAGLVFREDISREVEAPPGAFGQLDVAQVCAALRDTDR